MIEIEVSKVWSNKCRKFATDSFESSRQTWRVNKEKAMEDIYVGKMGEVGAFTYLCEMGHCPTPPDFEVYQGNRKSFDADIFMGDYNIHCKTQSNDSKEKYGISWIMQYGKRCDPLFNERTDKDIFVGMTLKDLTVSIHTIISVNNLFKYEAVELPAIKWLEESKRAVYFRTIKDIPTKIQWINF